MEKKKNDQFMPTFQLLYLSILTLFGMLLIIVASIAKSATWMIALYILLLAGMWAMYLAQLGSPRFRIYIYTLLATGALMEYGSFTTSLTDMPLVACLLIIILSSMDDIYLIYIISASYPVMVLYHIFITHYLNLGTDWIVLSRVILELICILIAVLISRYFIRNRHTDEKEKRTLETELQFTQKGNRNFLTGISHELRTPINAINGISEIMLNQKLEPEVHSQVDNIHKAGHRISNQMNSILDYAELSLGELVLNEKEYKIQDIIEEAKEALLIHLTEKNLQIITEYEDELPEVLFGDEQKIERIVEALLDNAYKFTSWGSITIHVGVRPERYGVNLNIDIVDTGCGMTEAQVKRLYYGSSLSENGRSRVAGGLGIGFTVAHSLVRSMNGFMNVISKPGIGTTTHVTIPQNAIWGDGEVKKEDEAESTDLSSYPELRVLAVDDEKMNLIVMRGILKTFDINVRAVESASEALAMCQLEDYDLIFLDYEMPEMSGVETMHRIRKMRDGFYAKTPIVVVSANAESGVQSMLLEAGFDDFMGKPIELSTMSRFLEKTAGGKKNV